MPDALAQCSVQLGDVSGVDGRPVVRSLDQGEDGLAHRDGLPMGSIRLLLDDLGASPKPRERPRQSNVDELEPVKDGGEVGQVVMPLFRTPRVDGVDEVQAEASANAVGEGGRHPLTLTGLTGIADQHRCPRPRTAEDIAASTCG
jgi:hypothetical protein